MEALYKMFPEDSNEFPYDEEALERFKKLINKNELKCKMDDIFLLGFLRAKKFNLERSLELLKNYYSRRIEHSEFCKDLLPSKLENALSLNCTKLLPKPDQNGRFIMISESEQWNPSETALIDLYRSGFLYSDLMLNLHRMQENGIVLIFNAYGGTIRKLLEFTPRFINTLITVIFRNTSQVRIKEIHYVNINPIIKGFLNIALPFFPEKVRKRVFLHSEMTTLHDYVHPKYLPVEYGGELYDYDPNEFVNVIKQNEDFFRENEESLKIYEEAFQTRFSEGRFKYIDPDKPSYEEKLLEESEEKFKHFKEDPENFVKHVEEDTLIQSLHL